MKLKKLLTRTAAMTLCLGVCLGSNTTAAEADYAACTAMLYEQQPGITSLYDEDWGVSAVQDNSYLPALKEGNYVRWIDRAEFPDYTLRLYDLLAEGYDNDGIDDFLIDPNSSDLVEQVDIYDGYGNVVSYGHGIKVTDLKASGKNWNEAYNKITDAFNESYYACRDAYYAFDRDCIDLFWVASSTYLIVPQYTGTESIDPVTGETICTYEGSLYFFLDCPTYEWDIRYDKYTDTDVIKENIAAVKEKAESIAAQTEGMSDEEKIVFFNDWLTKNNEYNYYIAYGQISPLEALYQMPDIFECTGALMENTGWDGPVCESYAKALKVLCDTAEIPCVVVSGFALTSPDGSGESHMWNYVELDGKWYGVDCTWNDPLGGKTGAVSGLENGDYLLVGADTEISLGNSTMKFIDSHPADNVIYEDGIRFTNGPVLSSVSYESEPKPEVKPTAEPTKEPTPEVKPTAEPTKEPTADVTTIFADVYTDWYTDYVQYVYDNQLMTGIKGTDSFAPNANITKAQVAQVLYNMEGQPKVTDKNVFTELRDVYEAEWYADAVAWAFNTGVVTGDLNTKQFSPNTNVTREQLALMIYRYAQFKNLDTSASDDLSGLLNAENASDWAVKGVKWAVGEGLISGIEKNGEKDLAPQGNASRAQVAAILQRFCNGFYLN